MRQANAVRLETGTAPFASGANGVPAGGRLFQPVVTHIMDTVPTLASFLACGGRTTFAVHNGGSAGATKTFCQPHTALASLDDRAEMAPTLLKPSLV